jgi:hypothetical protein
MGHESGRGSGWLAMLASPSIKRLPFRFCFIAPSFAATGFDAIILRSSLTGLRMTPGKHRHNCHSRMRAIAVPPHADASLSFMRVEFIQSYLPVVGSRPLKQPLSPAGKGGRAFARRDAGNQISSASCPYISLKRSFPISAGRPSKTILPSLRAITRFP